MSLNIIIRKNKFIKNSIDWNDSFLFFRWIDDNFEMQSTILVRTLKICCNISALLQVGVMS